MDVLGTLLVADATPHATWRQARIELVHFLWHRSHGAVLKVLEMCPVAREHAVSARTKLPTSACRVVRLQEIHQFGPTPARLSTICLS